jgi:excisionase family DNA binding protein
MISGGNRMTSRQAEKNEDEILTRIETAGMLKIPGRTLDYLVATGQIPFSRIGKRSVRFSRERLRKWLQEREGIEYRLPRA